MTEPFVVEVWGKPAGVVVKHGNAFRFHAIASPFFALDGAHFTTRGHARLAAARLEFDRGLAAREQDQARAQADGSADQSRDTGRSLGSASHWASSLPL
jgi:hypothetical protein